MKPAGRNARQFPRTSEPTYHVRGAIFGWPRRAPAFLAGPRARAGPRASGPNGGDDRAPAIAISRPGQKPASFERGTPHLRTVSHGRGAPDTPSSSSPCSCRRQTRRLLPRAPHLAATHRHSRREDAGYAVLGYTANSLAPRATVHASPRSARKSCQQTGTRLWQNGDSGVASRRGAAIAQRSVCPHRARDASRAMTSAWRQRWPAGLGSSSRVSVLAERVLLGGLIAPQDISPLWPNVVVQSRILRGIHAPRPEIGAGAIARERVRLVES